VEFACASRSLKVQHAGRSPSTLNPAKKLC
jgi:hypothetical protein